MRFKKVTVMVILSLLTLSSFQFLPQYSQMGSMEAHATLNPTWVVPANDVTLSDVQTFLDYTEWWLYESLTNGNTSGNWRPALFYNNRTREWSAEDLEYSGWFYDFYVPEAYLSTGDSKYLDWLKKFADHNMYDKNIYYCDTHEASSQISAFIAAYDLCYNRNNDALRNRIQQLIDHLIEERYNPQNGLWRVSKRVNDEYVWKMFYALRAITQWYEITGDPSLKNVMEKGLTYAKNHQDVYNGKQWYPFIHWNTGVKIGSGDFAEYHETQQGLDGLLYAGYSLNDDDFKDCFRKYLEWWCDKGIDSDGGIYGWYDANQNGLYNTYNGLVGELMYFLIRGYFWIGNSTYITSACNLFHKMTKWMTYTPEPAAYGYNCSYVLHYDLSTDNPWAFSGESDYGRQVDGFCVAVAYNGFNYLKKALPGYDPPKFFDLEVSSIPIGGISFTLNGTTETTPYSASLLQDNWTVVMPATFNSGGLIYSFSQWEDGSTGTTRTINLTSATSIVATYEPPPMHILSVETVPIASVPFTLDGASHATNYSATLLEGMHTVVMPASVSVGGINYRFIAWKDGSTGTTRTINLVSETSIVATYEPLPTYTLNVTSVPIASIAFTLDGSSHATNYSATLLEGVHTVVMPSYVTVGGINYTFVAWEDGSTGTTRTINLTSATSIVATYAPPPTYTLSIKSVPIADIAFTLDGTSRATNYSTTLFEGTHTVVMPSFVAVGGINYRFVAWEDGPTSTTRTINLNADTSITATYEVSPTPPPGTILFSSGFETGNFNEWDIYRAKTGSSITIASDKVHHGSFSSKKSASDGGYAFLRKNLASGQNSLSVRFYVYFSNLPTAAGQRCCLLKYSDVNYADIVWLLLYNNGQNVLLRLQCFYPAGTNDFIWNPLPNTWYCLELTFVKNINGEAHVYVDGLEVIMWTGNSNVAGTPLRVEIGAQEMNGYTQTLYNDCIVIADGYIGTET